MLRNTQLLCRNGKGFYINFVIFDAYQLRCIKYFQIFSSNYTNLVLSPFGLATSLAITMDCVQGESFDEITKLFKLQSKPARQQLRTGFKTILNDFRVMSSLFLSFSSPLYVINRTRLNSFRKNNKRGSHVFFSRNRCLYFA